MALKAAEEYSSEEYENMAYFTRKFHKVIRRNRFLRKENSSRAANANELCHNCGKSGYFIKYYPIHKWSMRILSNLVVIKANGRTGSLENKI